MTTPDAPTAAKTLLRQLAEGWSVAGPTYATGPITVTAYGEPRGDGTRPKIAVTEVVDSVLVRACHVDGRAVVALWIRRPGKGWSLDMAWRGRHPHEHAPRRITPRRGHLPLRARRRERDQGRATAGSRTGAARRAGRDAGSNVHRPSA